MRPGSRQRVLDLRRDGQQLDGGEERGVSQTVDVATLDAELELVGEERAGHSDEEREAEGEHQSRREPPVSLLQGEQPPELFADHRTPPEMEVIPEGRR